MITTRSIVPAIIELHVLDVFGVATELDLYVARPGTFTPLQAGQDFGWVTEAILHGEDRCAIELEIDRLAHYVGAWNLTDSPPTSSQVRMLLRVPCVRWQVTQAVARLCGEVMAS